MFRRCDMEADNMARKTMQIWAEGTISLPLLLPYDVPVKGSFTLQTHFTDILVILFNVSDSDITKCHPEVWKAIACTLQIKPCHKQVRATWICR